MNISENIHNVTKIEYKKNNRLSPELSETVDLTITFDPMPWNKEDHILAIKEMTLFLSDEFEGIVPEASEPSFSLDG